MDDRWPWPAADAGEVPPEGRVLRQGTWWRDTEHEVAPKSALQAFIEVAGENRGKRMVKVA